MSYNLSIEKKVQILNILCEGGTIRGVERITGVHRDTIMRLMIAAGNKANAIMERQIVDLKSSNIQIDEIYTYVYIRKRRGNTDPLKGEQYVFYAFDSDSKLIVSWALGRRKYETVKPLMLDLKMRIPGRFQLSSDSMPAFIPAVITTWGLRGIDYAVVNKSFDEPNPEFKRMYAPPEMVNQTKNQICGSPDMERVSTSYIERNHLSIRMHNKRFGRLINCASKKIENLACSVALFFFYYNFMRKHSSVKMTPAIKAGITNSIWKWEDLLYFNTEEMVA